MKQIKWYLFGLILFIGLNHSTAQDVVVVKSQLQGCSQKVFLYEFDGIGFRKSVEGVATSLGNYEFTLPASEPKFYYIGQSPSDIKPLMLGSENGVLITGTCGQMRSAKLNGSSLNTDYDQLKYRLNSFNAQSSKLARQYQRAGQDETQRTELAKKMKTLDEEKLIILDSLENNNPLFAKVWAINTYLSYPNHQGTYQNELQYFANEFFQLVDFKDEMFNQLPWVYERFKSYSETLANVGLKQDQLQGFLDATLNEVPKGSRTYQLALSGIIASLSKAKHPSFPVYAEQFIETYKESQPAAAADLKQQLDRMQSLMVGGTAPDFSQATPEGEDMKLSDLKGKVVLVDFWASWCGPCRKENPNVVKLYNKYKDKGFDILGVSLDKTKDRWLQAIEKDGLTWHHVSDLKGWKNAVAQQYGVSSIPHTILLDQEGKIIATKLRAHTLAAKLKEIFGE